MNKVEQSLLRTRKTLLEVCAELGITIDEVEIPNVQECTSCGIWHANKSLKLDLDGNLVCNYCWSFYGP